MEEELYFSNNNSRVNTNGYEELREKADMLEIHIDLAMVNGELEQETEISEGLKTKESIKIIERIIKEYQKGNVSFKDAMSYLKEIEVGVQNKSISTLGEFATKRVEAKKMERRAKAYDAEVKKQKAQAKRKIKPPKKMKKRRFFGLRKGIMAAVIAGIFIGGSTISNFVRARSQNIAKAQFVDTIKNSDELDKLSEKYNISEVDNLLFLEEDIEDSIVEMKDRKIAKSDLAQEQFVGDANKLKEIMKKAVLEKLSATYGYKFKEEYIEVTREIDVCKDGRDMEETEKANIKIRNEEYKLPKNLENMIVRAFGEKGIKSPVQSIDQIIEMVETKERII